MTSRSCKLNALAFSTSGQANVSVTINGSTVFSGVVPETLTSETPTEAILGKTESNRHNQMIDFEIDPTLTGDINLGISVTEGSLYFTSIMANYTAQICKVAAVSDNGTIKWMDVTNNAEYNSIPYTSDEVILGFNYLPTSPSEGNAYKILMLTKPANTPPPGLNLTLSNSYFPLTKMVMEEGLIMSDNITDAKIDNVEYERVEKWYKCIDFESDIDKGIGLFKFVIHAGSTFECIYNIPTEMVINPNLDLETQIKSIPLTTFYSEFNNFH